MATTKITFQQKAALILFGILLTVISLEAGLRLAGFTLSLAQEHQNRLALKQKGAYRIMCLGESTTANQYPRLLEQTLKSVGGMDFSVIDKGIIATNTTVILGQLESNLDRYEPQMVIVMMGINDIGQHLPRELKPAGEPKPAWQSWRVYKLIRLLGMHLTAKFKTAGSPKSSPADNPLPPPQVVNVTGNGSSRNMSARAPVYVSPEETRLMQTSQVLQDNGEFAKAEEMLREVVAKYPRNFFAYSRLGWICLMTTRPVQGITFFRKALKVKPNDPWSLIGLGTAYKGLQQYDKAAAVYKRAITVSPENDLPYIELAHCSILQGRYEFGKAVLREGIRHSEKKERLYGALAAVDLTTGTQNKHRQDFIAHDYVDTTVRNFRALHGILKRRGIRLVCMQYPMRSLAPLRSIFDDADGIIFIDNEKVFKTAVQKEGLLAYFTDLFGGDFGHCTEKGNRLLAWNIARTILPEIMRK